MPNNHERVGIIDIGSNSIRLAIYETTPQGYYRLINEIKESARLSGKMNAAGAMEAKEIHSIVPILRQFREVCGAYGCRTLRVAATAAIRNAANAQEIGRMLEEETGLPVEILTGEQEAYFGFVAVAGGMVIEDGFLIDIGGGSTEITYFRGRTLIESASLPIGAVNAQVKFGVAEEPWPPEQIAQLQEEVRRMLDSLPWIGAYPGLPLIGLGGTIRTLGKLDQRRRKYPLRLAHHYRLEPESLRHYAETLPQLPLEKRKRIDGLSKARADIIVPGITILQAVFDRLGAACCLVSGSGLREGLLQDTLGLGVPSANEVLERQAGTLLAFHALAPAAHYRQVRRHVELLYRIVAKEPDDKEPIKLLQTAAMVYKVGGTIRYHQYDKHTMYWLLQAPLGAFTHREAVLCSFIADYPANHGKKSGMEEFGALLQEKDEELVQKLGALLEVAVALDASETQTVEAVEAIREGEVLLLKLNCRSQAYLETRQLEAAAKSFKKAWDLRLEWDLRPLSTR